MKPARTVYGIAIIADNRLFIRCLLISRRGARVEWRFSGPMLPLAVVAFAIFFYGLSFLWKIHTT
jgi:hypothetical protein